jgi:UDP-3-O-[3-hydroxymyristoyl] N-acetylglucosamine deacetylase/3-hydroxyacyl-[acyl-carrier-protein] dehydratase
VLKTKITKDMKQKTLKGSFSLFGKGLHTGLNLTVTFNPAPENTGYKIQRIDMEGQPVIDAIAENVIDTQRGTVLGKGDARVSTVEHGLAALYALGVDNCMIQVNGPEFPILDGSAIKYVEKIKEIGVEEQNAPKDWYIIRKKIEVKDEQTGSVITILPDNEFSLTVMCSFESKFINSQFATINKVEDFATEIAPARTFVFVRDIMQLLQANLIKGGDMDNAIIIYEVEQPQDKLDALADLLGVPRLDASKLGYIQHKPIVWENECTRHKLLDVIGDMALIGKPIKGRIIATRPGHTINNKFARQMRRVIRKHEIQAPIYDPNAAPVIDNRRIRDLLPHRYPFQLVDKVVSIGATTIVGIKNVTSNEPFFQGHFPTEPVMPGVLMVEAMAQCGGLIVLNTMEEPEKYTAYFIKIDGVKFRKKVVPGDTLVFKVNLLGPVRHGISSLHGYAFVGDDVVCEATYACQIIKNRD